jgi:hypothetical protein
MTLKPPNPNIEPRFGEELDGRRLRDILARIQQNFDFLHGQFPVQGGNLSNGVLRLVAAGRGMVAEGSGVVAFSASHFSNQPEIEHGLGVVPARVLTTCSNPAVSVGALSRTNSKIKFQGYNSFGTETHEDTFDWIAIG